MRLNAEYPYQLVMISFFKLENAKFYSIRPIFNVFRFSKFDFGILFFSLKNFYFFFHLTEFFQILISEFFFFLLEPLRISLVMFS